MADADREGADGAPVFVVAPTRRCGTTLLQRAFNSSNTAIIYGENFIFMESYPALLPGVLDHLPLKKARTREVRQQLLGGNYDIDASAMFPEYEEYASIMRAHFYRVAEYYRRRSLDYGRPIWGLKHQIRRIDGFATFMRLLPKARYVFIYRNIFEVARSERARFAGEYGSAADFARLGRSWSQNMEFMRAVRDQTVLHLEYADLKKDVSGLVATLERHCGITGIKPEVFDRRVNVSPIIDNLDSQEKLTGYRPPAELSPSEYDALRTGAAAACDRFGYAVPSPGTG